jgi:bifunctional non-homologous end joining protein LigD
VQDYFCDISRLRLDLESLNADSVGALVRCGWAGSGLTTRARREIRAALDAKRPIVVDVDHRGLTPAGELRHPVVRAWRVD